MDKLSTLDKCLVVLMPIAGLAIGINFFIDNETAWIPIDIAAVTLLVVGAWRIYGR